MWNELTIVRRLIGLVKTPAPDTRPIHHDAREWLAYFHAIARPTAFERRFH